MTETETPPPMTRVEADAIAEQLLRAIGSWNKGAADYLLAWYRVVNRFYTDDEIVLILSIVEKRCSR